MPTKLDRVDLDRAKFLEAREQLAHALGDASNVASTLSDRGACWLAVNRRLRRETHQRARRATDRIRNAMIALAHCVEEAR